jgi:hypothetical protein
MASWGGAFVAAQARPPAAPAERVQLAEEVFTNIQQLKGLPVKEFMGTMGMFSASTGLNCVECHVEESGGNWNRYADETDLKRTARRMIGMVNSLNQSFFAGRRVVSCFTCHRGINRPQVIPDLEIQYGEPIILEPDEVLAQSAGEPQAQEILAKYIEATGGASRVSAITSLSATGTYQGFDDYEKYPLELHAAAPGQRQTVVKGAFGVSTWTVDGQNAWIAAPLLISPVSVMQVTGDELEGARVEAALAFPARIANMLVEWRVGDPAIIGDEERHLVQGKMRAGGLPIKLYFDPDTNLLVRLVYYNETPVGRIPTRIDYEDYRDVSGVKMPFKWTTTWTDGRSVVEIGSVQLNVPVDARRFAKPAPPA